MDTTNPNQRMKPVTIDPLDYDHETFWTELRGIFGAVTLGALIGVQLVGLIVCVYFVVALLIGD